MSDTGSIEVSPTAVATIAAEAVSECYGVVGMASRTASEAILTSLRRAPTTKGIRVQLRPDIVVVDVHVIIEYGTRIVTVADNVIDAVRFRLEQALGTSALCVNVYVQDVRVGTRHPGA